MRQITIYQRSFEYWCEVNKDDLQLLGEEQRRREYQRQLQIDKQTLINFLENIQELPVEIEED